MNDEVTRRRFTDKDRQGEPGSESHRGEAPDLNEKSAGDEGVEPAQDGAPEPAVPRERLRMAQEQVAQLRKRLLDLTNRNPLLNFRHRDRSRTHLRVVGPLPDDLLSELTEGKALSFNPLPEPDDHPRDEQSDHFWLTLERMRRTDEAFLRETAELAEDEAHSKQAQEIERRLKDRVRQHLGLPERPSPETLSLTDYARQQGVHPDYDLPHPEGRPDGAGHSNASHLQTLLLPEAMERKLSGLQDLHRSNLEETGVNTLYTAIGFLEWRENHEAAQPMHAPLLLHPIQCSRQLKRHEYRYTIVTTDEETTINLTLAERLKHDFGLRLPTLEEDESAEHYFCKVQEAIADKKGWRVRRWITVGHFAFARLVMYRDLDPAHWPIRKDLHLHPILGDLFGGTTREAPLKAEEYPVDSPEIAQKVPALITDADSSQLSSIVDVMEGRNLAIKGPPGTGKSQTITNIIAAALASGKRVLFVAEKMAALEVVKNRLDTAGIGDFCLELHSTKARKKELLEELNRRLELPKEWRRASDLENALDEARQTREELTDYLERIHQPVGRLERSLYELMWAEQRLREEPTIPDAACKVRIPHAREWTPYAVDRGKQLLRTIEEHARRFHHEYGGRSGHPWHGVRKVGFSPAEEDRLIEAMKDLRQSLADLGARQSALPKELAAEGPVRPSDLEGLAEILPEVRQFARERTDWIDPTLLAALAQEEVFEAFQELAVDLEAYRDRIRDLNEKVVRPGRVAAYAEELQEAAREARHLKSSEAKVGDLDALSRQASHETAHWEGLRDYAARLLEILGLDEPPLAHCLAKPLEAVRLLAATDRKILVRRDPKLIDETHAETLQSAAPHAHRLRRRLEEWSQDFDIDLNDSGLAARLRHEAATLDNAGRLAWLKPAARQAKRFYRRLRRRHTRAGAAEMADHLKGLAELVESIHGLVHDDRIKAACGDHFNGLDTDFDTLAGVNQWAAEVRQAFGGGRIGRHLRAVLLHGRLETLEDAIGLAREPIRPSFEEALDSLLRENGDFQEQWDNARRQRDRIARLLAVTDRVGVYETIPVRELASIAESLGELQGAVQRAQKNTPAARHLTPHYELFSETDDALLATGALARLIHRRVPWEAVRRFLLSESFDARLQHLESSVQSVQAALASVRRSLEGVTEAGELDPLAYFHGEPGDKPIDDTLRRIDFSLEATETLKGWTAYLQAVQEAGAQGLDELLAVYDREERPYSDLPRAFDRALYRTLIESVFEEQPKLRRYSGISLDQARQRFRELDREILELQRHNLKARLSQSRIDPGDGTGPRSSWTGLKLLRHEMGKKQRHLPIRELFSRAGSAVQQLKPCFMMSPLSVAQFLKQGDIEFDLVVIDEASQMRPEDSLGAIARGSQLVVVGDPMQLPPTSFFERHEPALEEETNPEDLVDNESILDLALATYQPARQLRWHYRSRHGSLIAFSNHHFYDNDLVVFPAPIDQHAHFGIQRVFVEGSYKGRVNVPEARQVAEAAIELMHRHPDRSLGIVALNQPQRELLADEIDRRVSHDEQAQSYIEQWESRDGGLQKCFIKNLENVQGDERDAILISTVFGPDETTGRIMQRFGPINSPTGHRRLNVLFTRAKRQLVLFTSLQSTDIRTEGASTEGVRAFRNYLEFAETGSLESSPRAERDPEGELQAFLMERLRGLGYDVVPQIGVQNCFIDLAVRHPGRPEQFILGIEGDGPRYHAGQSARDRDRLRQETLEGLGWNLYRVWSTDWFADPEGEIRRLRENLQNLNGER